MLSTEKKVIWFAVGAVVLWLMFKPDAPADSAHPHKVRHAPRHALTGADLAPMACVAAQRAVKAKLKSPSTADFPSCGWSLNEYVIHANPELTKFGVEGHVDSQNGFGAMIRSKFVVLLDKGPGDGSSAFTPTGVAIE
jgi:hypothetical protein